MNADSIALLVLFLWVCCVLWGVAVLKTLQRIERDARNSDYQIQRSIIEFHASMRDYLTHDEKPKRDDLSKGEFK